MDLFIMMCILVFNIVAFVTIYKCLGNMDVRKKLIITIVGIAVIYMITTLIYSISSVNIENQEISNRIKDLITFAFVPINSIIALPFLARTYSKYKDSGLEKNQIIKRIIIISVIMIIAFVIEISYFKDIGQNIMDIANSKG